MRTLLAISLSAAALAACRTTPEPEVPVVEVAMPDACVPLARVEAVTIPEETETYYGITEIENPPYEPIIRREEMTRVVKEAYVVYRRPDGTDVDKANICEFKPVEPDPVMDGVGAGDATRG